MIQPMILAVTLRIVSYLATNCDVFAAALKTAEKPLALTTIS